MENENETNVDDVNKQISEVQADEVAQGVDKTDEVESASEAPTDEEQE